MDRSGSERLFTEAKQRTPGGVNSPVRAFRGVGGTPVFFARAAGPYLYDVDGNQYVDYVGSWGPAILGHAHPEVVAAIHAAVDLGTTFGAPTPGEVRFAEEISALVPSMQKLRLVSSGTEATMAALRLARGATGRTKIIKIDGAYHGHADFLLVGAGSGAATLGIPGSAGVTEAAARDTLTVAWNDLPAMRAIFAANASLPSAQRIAALIVEPVCGNMGCVPPAPGYLEALRELTAADGALLIFDEVMTGFRVALGGVQAQHGITPDLTCLGKIVGGGLPLAAYGGRAEIMAHVAPDGPVYQAGTLSGNPVAVAAGRKTLQLIQAPGTYERLTATTRALCDGFGALLTEASIPHVINQAGAMWTVFFSTEAVTDYASAKRCDTARFGRFFHGMLDHGIYLPPSQFEAAFTSLAHDAETTARTLDAARATLKSL